MSRALVLLSLLALGCRTPSAEPTAPPVYGALPIRNLTAEPEAPADLMRLLRRSLEARGAVFAPDSEVETNLRARRIRYTDSLSRDQARSIAEATGVRFLVLGTLLVFERGNAPRISLALRVLDTSTGGRAQSSVITLRGEDFEGLLGLGAIDDADDLAEEVVARSLDIFTARGWPRTVESEVEDFEGSRPSKPLSRFVSEGFDLDQIDRIAVLPLDNRTNRPAAGYLFAELLAHEWFAACGIEVIEQSELRAAMVTERLRSVAGIELDTLAKIGRTLNTRYFLLGSINVLDEDVYVAGGQYPEIEASIRIVDVESGRIVAAGTHGRRGDHYRKLLGLGSEHDIVSLGLRVARELIAVIGA